MNSNSSPSAVPMRTAGPAFWLVAGFMAIALAVGGAGTKYPLLELVVELAGLPILFCFAAGIIRAPTDGWSRAALFILGLILIVPLAQLVPLPASIQHELSGRERYQQLFAIMGAPERSLPISLDPEATLRAFLELLTGVAAFLGIMALTIEQRMRVIIIVLGFAVISAALGALQAAGIEASMVFDSTQGGLALGLFANRNHHATFLNIAVVLAGAAGIYPADRGKNRWAIALPLIALFVAGVIGTRSRTGIALLFISVPAALMLLSPAKARWRTGILGIASLAALAAVLWFSSAGQVALARFDSVDDARFGYWRDSKLAITTYWPIGSGFGTFPNIFEGFESLGSVQPHYVNHAHNDYVELLLEGGAASACLTAIAIALLIVGAVARARSARSDLQKTLTLAGVAGVGIVLIHSVVDYPLRMPSLAALFGCLAALALGTSPAFSAWRWKSDRPLLRVPRATVAGIAIIALAYEAICVHGDAYAVRSGDVRLAQSFAPRSAHASTWLAQHYLAEGQISAAATMASQALRLSPIHSGALSVLAIAEAAMGRPLVAAKLMDFAAGAGWRDPLAEAWLLDAALKTGSFEVAAERADALLRQNVLEAQTTLALRQLLESPQGRAAVIARLSDDPAWRKKFLTDVSRLSDSQLTDQSQLMMEMRTKGAALNEGEWSPLVKQLVSAGRLADGHKLWASMRRGRNIPDLFDGDFDQLAKDWPGSGIPFEWSIVPSPEAEVSIDSRGNPNDPTLRITAEAGAAGPVLQQLIVLPPGTHALAGKISGANASAVRPDLRCIAGQHLDLTRADGATDQFAFRFVVPGGCEAQWLRLVLTGEGAAGDLWLNKIAIR